MMSKERAKLLLDNTALGGDLKYSYVPDNGVGSSITHEEGVTRKEDALLKQIMTDAPASKNPSIYLILCDIVQGRINEHGNYVGSRGKTGVHAVGLVHRDCSIIPRSQGGVLVIVSSYLDVEDGADELRFESESQATDYIDKLRPMKSPKNGIPF